MIEQEGRVVALEPGYAWVQPLKSTTCEACANGGGCGQLSLARLLGREPRPLRLACHLDLGVGDRVALGLSEQALLQASFTAYLIPLLGLVGGALLGGLAGPGSDLAPIAGGLAGFMLGLGVAFRRQGRLRKDPAFSPRLLRRLEPAGSVGHFEFPYSVNQG